MVDHGESAANLSGELTPFGHRLRARVYFADTDFSGVVYHARYLEFFERGRSDFLRLAGVHHTELADGRHGEKLVWIVKRMEIDFRAAARIHMAQRIGRGASVLVEAKVEAALINGEGRPRRFPSGWAAAFLPAAPIAP